MNNLITFFKEFVDGAQAGRLAHAASDDGFDVAGCYSRHHHGRSFGRSRFHHSKFMQFSFKKMTQDNDKSWYLIHTYSGHEDKGAHRH